MKGVIIFCVRAFYDDLLKIYNNTGVETFNEFDVKGFNKMKTDNSESLNWFASSKDYYDSIATFAFMKEDLCDTLFEHINEFNENMDCCSPIHAYRIDVEKFIHNL
ncbi:hypothetical protein [Ancylomarina longa]|uniref:Uncharacterized protein n=1 Tax=Ancylomarina longa TaxID=2487017 RepID=A0A434AZ46_9BACT|nr:hypothetical protein [Ancylomarina longa]RUT79893.1 hypothetical protein DLK05_00635 [Ancylomarina longa]